jgi:hypothetical protein
MSHATGAYDRTGPLRRRPRAVGSAARLSTPNGDRRNPDDIQDLHPDPTISTIQTGVSAMISGFDRRTMHSDMG